MICRQAGQVVLLLGPASRARPRSQRTARKETRGPCGRFAAELKSLPILSRMSARSLRKRGLRDRFQPEIARFPWLAPGFPTLCQTIPNRFGQSQYCCNYVLALLATPRRSPARLPRQGESPETVRTRRGPPPWIRSLRSASRIRRVHSPMPHASAGRSVPPGALAAGVRLFRVAQESGPQISKLLLLQQKITADTGVESRDRIHRQVEPVALASVRGDQGCVGSLQF